MIIREIATKSIITKSNLPVCDPYQPCEKEFGRTQALLEQLSGSGARLSIQTKSDLVLRDLDFIRKFPEARVGFSINTLDKAFRAETDDVVSIERRLAAMKTRHAAGIRTTRFISPIFPGITDVPAIVRRAVHGALKRPLHGLVGDWFVSSYDGCMTGRGRVVAMRTRSTRTSTQA